MIKGFKEFILRGNIVDLAVAFVIGTAFAAVVSTFVSAIVKPIISSLPGGKSTGLGFSLRGGVLKQATFIDISTLVNAIIVFVMTALVVYFVLVVPMNRLAERRRHGQEPDAVSKAEDVLLLEEIRDLLRAQRTT